VFRDGNMDRDMVWAVGNDSLVMVYVQNVNISVSLTEWLIWPQFNID
jgi:hypothetical protein